MSRREIVERDWKIPGLMQGLAAVSADITAAASYQHRAALGHRSLP
jgi:hypothetical protein